MGKIERIFLYAVLTFCAVMLAVLVFNSIQTQTAEQARLAEVQKIQILINQNITDISGLQVGYEQAAYNNARVDTISKQQLLAAENTNALLGKLADQIALLAQIQSLSR